MDSFCWPAELNVFFLELRQTLDVRSTLVGKHALHDCEFSCVSNLVPETADEARTLHPELKVRSGVVIMHHPSVHFGPTNPVWLVTKLCICVAISLELG